MKACMLTLFVLMVAVMCFTMAEPVPVDAAEAEPDMSSNVRQKRQFLFGYPSYRSYGFGYGYGFPSYGRLYYPSYSIWGR